MSMGYLIPPSSPIVWRGMMVQKALQQLLHSVSWSSGGSSSTSGLDILILDLPPGTGDVQLSIAQQIHLAGSLVVTTPHALALADARRGIAMLRKTGVPVLGLVENMGSFACPGCGGTHRIFGDGSRLRALAAEESAPVLADLPLHRSVGDDAERGRPTVVAEPESERARIFLDLARTVGAEVGLEGRDG